MTIPPFKDWPRSSGWTTALSAVWSDERCRRLAEEVDQARRREVVYPSAGETFQAFALTPPESVKVVLLGQDPYHGRGQAHGLSFSVRRPQEPPPSLVNIFKEMNQDLGLPIPVQGDLSPWAKQGVLLLNTVLTVSAGAAHSHRKLGWQWFTDAVIDYLAQRSDPIVFLLWGKPAERTAARLNGTRHGVFVAPHPSPLSAYRGFFGSRPFSKANRFLAHAGRDQVDWSLPAHLDSGG